MEVPVFAVAEGSDGHHAFVDEAAALVEVPRTGVVFNDVEEEAVRMEIFGCQLNQILRPKPCRGEAIMMRLSSMEPVFSLSPRRITEASRPPASASERVARWRCSLHWSTKDCATRVQGDDACEVVLDCGS